ncbi:MAG: MBOAT family O-acyltransferase [Planctomycetota bacterium]|jgi:D-alanyl-lipoteichoic acid acyltransferase DltB (MBOAT superfamily)
MTFNSLEFAVFFVIVFGLYRVLARRGQNVLLLMASYVFYGFWDWRFLSLVLISTVVDYTCGWGIHLSRTRLRRKAYLLTSLSINLGLLCFFKYFNFFAEGLRDLLASVGMQADWGTLNIVLPLGISFYTFQTLSYTIDIYRRQLEPTRDLLGFALFVAFFPQLVIGPIERARVLLPQIQASRRVTWPKIYDGAYLILWGAFKKIFVADNLIRYVTPAFTPGVTPDTSAAWLALWAFAIQLYCDFSGYSDIARGTAKCLGFELMVNFNVPYAATNPKAFWRRWHISLSTWIRDYLYISLGGSRGSSWYVARNLIITMSLCGLWHGATVGYILWGVAQGVMLSAYRSLEPMLSGIRFRSRTVRSGWWFLCWFFFFNTTCLSFMLFRSPTLAHLGTLFGVLFQPASIALNAAVLTVAAYILFYCLALIVIQVLQYRTDDLSVTKRWPWPVRSVLYAYLFYGIVIFGATNATEFFYFRF